MNEIICGDSRKVLKTLKENSVDLVVTSPPYDNLRDYEGYSFDFENIAKELYRILKVGGVIVWVVGDQTKNGTESGTSFRQALFFKELGLNLHDTMIYEKDNKPLSHNRYEQRFEYMFVFSKGAPKTFNGLRDVKNKHFGSKISSTVREKDGKTYKVSGAKSGKTIAENGLRGNVWRFPVGKGKTTLDVSAYEHPAMFPESLANDHILSWSNEGDLVLDPFNGSGTTTKCARYLKRRYIGIDISERYCEIARDRLSQNLLF